MELDATCTRWLNELARRSPRLQTATGVAAEGLAPVEVALMCALALSGKRASALRMLLAVSAVYGACEVLGRVWPRLRPFAEHAEILALVEHDALRAFPSRHVASGLAMATIGAAEHQRLGLTMAAVAWALGLSRVAAGLHYPSDVAAGALLGLVIGYALRP